MARAMFNLCFCPPDTVIPRSPISVKSPLGNMSRSGRRAQASTTSLYHLRSYSLPNVMLSLTVAFWIQAYCGQKARLPAKVTLPPVLRISPANAPSRELLPEPTPPMIATSSLRPISRLMSLIEKGLSSSASVLLLTLDGSPSPPSFSSCFDFRLSSLSLALVSFFSCLTCLWLFGPFPGTCSES